MKRLYFYGEDLGKHSLSSSEMAEYRRYPVATVEESNLIGSETGHFTDDDWFGEPVHMPVLDIDFPADLRPSETPGHFHLFLDKPMPWSKYRRLLKALAEAGIIEEGYARASIERGGTFVATKPWKKVAA